MKYLKIYEEIDFDEDDWDYEEEEPNKYHLVRLSGINTCFYVLTEVVNRESLVNPGKYIVSDNYHLGKYTIFNLNNKEIDMVLNNQITINIISNVSSNKEVTGQYLWKDLPKNIKDKISLSPASL